MAIDSSSTISEILAQYVDNADWDGDSTKAALALQAVRILLVKRPESSETKDRKIDYASLEKEKERLESYIDDINASAGSTGINRVTFTKARAVRA